MARKRNRDEEEAVVDAALATMDATELRELIDELLLELSARAYSRVVNELLERTARGNAEWVPAGPSEVAVEKILAFTKSAQARGYADPREVDDALQQGVNAFLGRNYELAFRIYRALLLPIGNADIDLGQHELVDEVLGVDVDACAAQYVVSVYMISSGDERPEAIAKAIDEVRSFRRFGRPVRSMERVSVEPLVGLEKFLPGWMAHLERTLDGPGAHLYGDERKERLREVVYRLEGVEGLGGLARESKSRGDLNAWCDAFMQAQEWEGAISAYGEAAMLSGTETHALGDFLDGAALAAQELGRRDLPVRLERAWREAPQMRRLRRWLGSSGSKAVIRRRARKALTHCPDEAIRQRALLSVLIGDHASAAQLLADAPGLGWSGGEHPGHLLFPMLCKFLGGQSSEVVDELVDDARTREQTHEYLDPRVGPDGPQLVTPGVDELLQLAGVDEPSTDRDREAMLEALKAAAEKRVRGVTRHKRRRYYGHATSLVAACVRIDPSSGSWLTRVRSEYRRYPALMRELNQRLKSW